MDKAECLKSGRGLDKGKEMSLYVHIPFCMKKCNYCDFLSSPASEDVKKDYVNKLCMEIEKEAVLYPEYRIKTVFFGGGTPTVLPAEQLIKILCKLKGCFVFEGSTGKGTKGASKEEERLGRDEKDAEITIECNPGTVDRESLRMLREAGFNRLSIGLQSAQMEELVILGRIHSWEDFLETYHTAREVGFHNINIDVMSALPGQSLVSYQDTLNKVLALFPEHISAYSLMIEEGTPFAEIYGEADRERQRDGQDRRHLLPTEEEERQIYDLTGALLGKNGYHRYEISNYARPGFECRHNIVYWERGNYLGFGLGAASFVENCRFTKKRDLGDYLGSNIKKCPGIGSDGSEREILDVMETMQSLTDVEQMEEFMFLGLRMTKGISCEGFRECFQVKLEDIYGETVEKLEKQGFLLRKGDRICLTKSGVDISNIVLAEFLF